MDNTWYVAASAFLHTTIVLKNNVGTSFVFNFTGTKEGYRA
jgi:hypothetical protein